METFAYLASSDDIKNRSLKDWLSAHYTFGHPLHRYTGTLSLSDDTLQFTGIDTKNKDAAFSLTLFRHHIEELYLGFDDVFKMIESRGLGLFWHPIRIKIIDGKFEEYIYLITLSDEGYNTDEWFEALQDWCT